MDVSFETIERDVEQRIIYSDAEKIERHALGLPASEPSPAGLINRMPKNRPASTGIQARICRSDLLVEIEALAILYHGEFEQS